MKRSLFPLYRGLLPVAVLLLLSGVMASAAGAAPYAYVANNGSDSVSVIDTANDTVVSTVPVGSFPLGVAVSPDGSRVYVTNGGSSSVSVIDAATDTVVSTVTVGTGPAGIAVSPDGSRVYVTNGGSSSVSVIDAATDTVVATVNVGSSPRGVAVSPDGSRAYVTNNGSSSGNTVSVIDTATDAVVSTVTVGTGPLGVAVSPDGSRVYVANFDGDSFSTVSVIDTVDDTVVATVPVGSGPTGVAVSPDGSRVYVANEGSSTVSVIDTANDTVVSTVPVGTTPQGVAVSPDGSRVYVANANGGTVSVIDAATDTVVSTVTIGTTPFSLGAFVGPGALIAGNSRASGNVGSQITASVPALGNGTTCATSDVLVQSPIRGSVVFTAATGAYTYTPSSATYSGPDVFTWQGQASLSCTAADSPSYPVSNTAAVLFTINPVLAGLADVTLGEKTSTTESFALTGTAPFTVALASSDPAVLPASDVTVSSGCGTTEADLDCTLKLVSGSMAGVSHVTVTAEDAFGDTVTGTMAVTVAAPPPSPPPPPPSASGGGGGFSPLALGILAGLMGLLGWTRRRRAGDSQG